MPCKSYVLALSRSQCAWTVWAESYYSAVLPSERAQFSAIIDTILANSDLSTITAKQIRKQLQSKVIGDISEKKVGSLQASLRHKYRFAPDSLIRSEEF